jgi:ADP-ribosylglycohydrolase
VTAARGPRRVEGLLLGLAAGDAAGWPAARHRAARMPGWTRRLTRELDTFAEENAITTLPVPVALNQSPQPLRLGPSDDAEWAAFAAEAVLRARNGGVLVPEGALWDENARGSDGTLGHYSTLGDAGTLGHYSALGHDSTLGHGGAPANLGTLGNGGAPGNLGTLGHASTLRNASTLGNKSALGHSGALRHGGVLGRGSNLGDLGLQRRMRAAIDLSWNAVAAEVAAAAGRAPEAGAARVPLRARISVRAGLGNLATGLRPPAAGHDNPHYFDDAACVRACVLAVAHPGDPRLAAELAEFDARYTQDGDGVHGARAMAAALSLALTGEPVDTCVTAALAELPESTEIGRNARQALRLARDAEGAFCVVPLLEHQIVDHVYSYGVAAAETVPVALALATAALGRIAEAVPAAACLSRVADSAPALAGALTGALGGGDAIPPAWRDACRTLPGCALPRLTGMDLVRLAELLEATEPAAPGG